MASPIAFGNAPTAGAVFTPGTESFDGLSISVYDGDLYGDDFVLIERT